MQLADNSEHNSLLSSAMARKRATAGGTAELSFVQKLAKSLLATHPGLDPQVIVLGDPAHFLAACAPTDGC